MTGLSIQPMQWALLPELADTPDIDDSDLACMEEVRAVLARHGKLQRFALHLAHRHFDLAEHEILIERQDVDERSQRITVGLRGDEIDARPTTWLFDERPILDLSAAAYCVCVSDPTKTAACIRHGKSRSPGEADQRNEAVKNRRIADDKAKHEQGFPVAGHDPADRGRSR